MRCQSTDHRDAPRHKTPRASVAVAAVLATCLIVIVSPAVSQSTGETAEITGTPTAAPHDPFRRFNRGVFRMNAVFDRLVIHPIVRAYRVVTPAPLRRGLGNVVHNLDEPVTVLNAVLQRRPQVAMRATARFVTNSTVGLLGLFDVAGAKGLKRETADFGQTLGRYGVKPGPYLYLPLIGPTTLRDGFGTLADTLVDPVSQATGGVSSDLAGGRMVAGGLDTRSELDPALTDAMTQSTDPYATIQSAYLQNREAVVREATGETQTLPDFDAADAVSDAAPDVVADLAVETPPQAVVTTENPSPKDDPRP